MFVIESEPNDKVFSLFCLIEPSVTVKEKLGALGGVFHSALRCKSGQVRRGWLFSADRLVEVQKFIDSNNEDSEVLAGSDDEREHEMTIDELGDIVMDLIARIEAVERVHGENALLVERVESLEAQIKRKRH